MMLDETPRSLNDPCVLADLNGSFVIAERVDDDLLLTLHFDSPPSLIMVDRFFATHSGPGFGPVTTPSGILEDEDAVPILAALFGDGTIRAGSVHG